MPGTNTNTGSGTGSGTVTTTFNPSGNAGTTTTYVSSSNGASTVTAQLQDSSITINAGCGTFSYTGLWAIAIDGSVTVQGEFVNLSTSSGQPRQQGATAVVRFTSGGGVITVSVTNARGEILVARITLTRSTALVTPPLAIGC